MVSGLLVRLAPWLLACGVTMACAESPAEGEPALSFQPLVELTDFREVAREQDPFATEPLPAPCPLPGFVVEQQWLEIDTRLCNWATLVAEARFSVTAGQRVRLAVSHFDLDAPSPSEGVARLHLGSCEAWSKTVPIPSPAAVYDEDFESACAITKGDSVFFHLHNHGQNNWQLREVALER